MGFDKDVRQHLGDDVANYVARKNRGGASGKKGARYEDFFTAYRVAVELNSFLCAGVETPTFTQQGEAFVDDLIVCWTNAVSHYQCKNATQVKWTSGDHPIADDFSLQVRFCKAMHQTEPKTILVVACESLEADLQDAMPSGIAEHSAVEFFPYCEGSLNRLVLECEKLRESLKGLARVSTPSDDELANVLGGLLIALIAGNAIESGEALAIRAQAQSPHLIRLLPAQEAEMRIEADFTGVLDGIEGLEYGMDRGFFFWKAFGIDGVFPYSCISPEFAKFQKRVITSAPSTAEEFEVLT
ncbi:hypothetical protein [Stenotrophomonas lactitubi]|uniref:hypothetical protein n=1 Tax=Stenotrophomonas lactitubi TaxID=2045214 RepID=UPI00320B00C3